MSKEPNNIDHLVREKLDGFEMAPPPSVWKNTSASLASGRNKRFFLWFALGFTALATAGAGIYYFSSEKTSSEQLALDNRTEQSSDLTKDEASYGKNGKSSGNNSTSAKGKLDSEDGIELKSENATDTGNYISDEDLNSGRNFSSINRNMTRDKIDDRNEQNDQKNQSKKDNSLKSARAGAGVDSSNDKTSSDLSDNPTDNDQKEDKAEGNSPSTNDDSTSSNWNGNGKSNDKNITQSNSANSNLPENYSSLNTVPIKFFTTEDAQLNLDEIEEEEPLPVKDPFWKSISLEGALGMSTFKNQPNKKTTESSLYNLINNAASNEHSYDLRIGANYHFTPTVSFQTGLEFRLEREDYAFKAEQITFISYLDSTFSFVDSMTMDTVYNYFDVIAEVTEIVDRKERNQYTLLTLPFQFAYSKPIGPRGELEFALGGALTIFGKNTGTLTVDQSNYTVLAQSGYHTKGMFSVGGSLKYIHRFGEHHAVYLAPWARFGVTNQSKAPITYTSVRNKYGVRFGYRFYF